MGIRLIKVNKKDGLFFKGLFLPYEFPQMAPAADVHKHTRNLHIPGLLGAGQLCAGETNIADQGRRSFPGNNHQPAGAQPALTSCRKKRAAGSKKDHHPAKPPS